MEDTWYGCSEHDVCRAVRWTPNGQVSISRSVGAGGANLAADVKEIQQALNRIPSAQGGAAPPLAVDGWCGPLTTGAIRRFQQTQFPGWTPDARIDPGQKTLARLNALLGGEATPPAPVITNRQGLVGDSPSSAPSADRPLEIDKAYEVVPEALSLVRGARHRLFGGIASLMAGNSLFTSKTGDRAVLEWNFKVHRATDPVAHLRKILGVYDRMEQTLFMASRRGMGFSAPASFQLFLPSNGSPLEKTAAAYTTAGGFFYGLAELDTRRKEYKNAIYITPQFAEKSFKPAILIHELGHYCGGMDEPGADRKDIIGHTASRNPPPKGARLEDGLHNYADMTPNEAYRNASSYSAYCYPQSLGKPPG